MTPLFVVFYNLRSVGPVYQLASPPSWALGRWSSTARSLRAMSIRTRSREVMLPLILFPISIPALLAMVGATTAILTGEGSPYLPLVFLAVYDVVFTLVGLSPLRNGVAGGMRSNFSIFALFTLGSAFLRPLPGARRRSQGSDHGSTAQRIFYYHVPSAWVMELCFFAELPRFHLVSHHAQARG